MLGKLSISDKIKLVPFWLLSLLPLGLLYVISDFLFIILYYLAGYRKQVVLENLRNSFPEYDLKKLKAIRRKFYRYLSESFFESIYLINMGIGECNRRYEIANIELLEALYKQGKDVIITTSHYGNWEWSANIPMVYNKYKTIAIYKPISNKVFDKLYFYIRSKFGVVPVPMKEILRHLVSAREQGERFALLNVGDQRPMHKDLDHWMSFMNQDTPVITGWERMAKKFDLAVVFLDLKRIKRGYYYVTIKLITDSPREEETFKIAEKYMLEVEKLIKRDPEFYLWSHKRWKFKSEEITSELTNNN